MPIFEFKCQSCGQSFELLVGLKNNGEKPKCSACGSADVRRLFSSFGFSSGGGATSGGQSSFSSCGSCTASNCSSCRP